MLERIISYTLNLIYCENYYPLAPSSTEYLSEIPEVTFLSLTNKLTDTPTNVISTGVNSISQLNAIKKFQKSKNLERTI